MKHRIPRRCNLGGGYIVEIALVTQSVLRDVTDDPDGESGALDGAWDNLLPDEAPVAGRIYIDKGLPAAKRWEVYWHEMIHALNDIAAWHKSRLGL